MAHPKTARIVRGTARQLAALAAALRRGEIVGVPTETVYGLAANALDAVACRKIFRLRYLKSTKLFLLAKAVKNAITPATADVWHCTKF